MTESIRSVNIVVRLDFKGHDVSNDTIKEAIANMEYDFHYNDYYLRIIDTEIISDSIED